MSRNMNKMKNMYGFCSLALYSNTRAELKQDMKENSSFPICDGSNDLFIDYLMVFDWIDTKTTLSPEILQSRS